MANMINNYIERMKQSFVPQGDEKARMTMDGTVVVLTNTANGKEWLGIKNGEKVAYPEEMLLDGIPVYTIAKTIGPKPQATKPRRKNSETNFFIVISVLKRFYSLKSKRLCKIWIFFLFLSSLKTFISSIPKNHLCILLFIEIDEEIFCLFGGCTGYNRLCSQGAGS